MDEDPTGQTHMDVFREVARRHQENGETVYDTSLDEVNQEDHRLAQILSMLADEIIIPRPSTKFYESFPPEYREAAKTKFEAYLRHQETLVRARARGIMGIEHELEKELYRRDNTGW
tara:strand:+ start:4170 stop:4520 length:351 start_codon:yes stop_codon:yes gene_type:complete